jgi:hypothetical protein
LNGGEDNEQCKPWWRSFLVLGLKCKLENRKLQQAFLKFPYKTQGFAKTQHKSYLKTNNLKT